MPRLVSVGLALALFFCATFSSAQESLDKQISLLKSSEDFRVRTQAALSLGASANKRAVQPLCLALDDSNRTVRIAAASALGRLQLGGKECLQSHLSSEQHQSVKASIQRALEKLGGAGGAAPTIDPSTKYYLAIGPAGNDSNASDAPERVRRAMETAAKALGGYVVAPEKESLAQAKTLLAKHAGVKAFYLAPKVAKPRYHGGKLTISLSVAMLSYPDKVMLGQFSVKLTQEDVPSPDPKAEQELITMAADSALQKFAKHAPQL
jgi:hypothetical protein